jgi:tetratricopeptide (TPR) repeat protein
MLFPGLRSTETLFNHAWNLIEEGGEPRHLQKAQRIAKVLRKRRFSGSFEIEAKVHAARNQPEMAIATLEEGLRIAPKASPNLLLLGILQSDHGRLQDAIDNFHLGIVRFPDEGDLYRMNLAESLARAESFDEALSTVRRVTDREWTWRAKLLEISILNRANRHSEVEALAKKHLAETASDLSDDERWQLRLNLLHAQLSNNRDPREVLAELDQLPREARISEEGLVLRYEARNESVPDGLYYNLMVNWEPCPGDDGDTIPATGCFINYSVFGRDEQQARDLIVELEGRTPTSVELQETQAPEPESTERRAGVTWVSPMFSYDSKRSGWLGWIRK